MVNRDADRRAWEDFRRALREIGRRAPDWALHYLRGAARALEGVGATGGGKDVGYAYAPVHVSLRSGNTLVVTATEQQQEVIADLLTKLGEARGPQVQLGTNIARQRAEGLGVQPGPARLPPVDSDGQAADDGLATHGRTSRPWHPSIIVHARPTRSRPSARRPGARAAR